MGNLCALRELDLTQSNLIVDVDELPLALARNRSLERLTLAYSRLGCSESVQHKNLLKIINACMRHPSLWSLDVRGLYDYHYDDDLTRPVDLFREVVNAIVSLLKCNKMIKTVLVDEMDHPSLEHPLAALSFYAKLNSSGYHSLLSSESFLSELTDKSLFDRHELGYLFSVVRSNPLLRADY
eukprot:CAMPEP_0172472924 /NCGR_PEP_ID=MMETSP1065-20121228/68595_1 /TAXON_ID=265537 /ORGANISM="Amphiprora paludosa, Strain CCMP125" /LENGTH=181 /DNA_ID=CAMNT_0013231093 /DNA_START=914 /DNA_END=1459 /DNA_ORIENTATION=+